MLDIHVAVKPGVPFTHVIRHVKHQMVTVHVTEHVPGDVLSARRSGYSMGSNPFVTWIDPDDQVLDLSWLPEALVWMQDEHVSAIAPRWETTGKKRYVIPVMTFDRETFNMGSLPHGHHLTIMRRANVEWALSQLTGPSVQRVDSAIVRLQQKFGTIRQHPAVAYRWFLQEGTARSVQDTDHRTIELMRRCGSDR